MKNSSQALTTSTKPGRSDPEQVEVISLSKKPTRLKIPDYDWRSLSQWDWLRLFFWAIMAVALLPGLLAFLGHSFEVIGWQYQVDYDEGLNLSSALNLSQGRNIYANKIPERFIAAHYPTLYFGLNALGIKIWGIQFGFGRALSFVASLAIAGLVGYAVWLWARRSAVQRLDAVGAGLVVALLWFNLPPVYIWSTFYKQDMVAIAIALLAIVLVYRWQDSKWLYLTAPLMALAFFAKQNELLASAVGCGYILLRDWRRGWKLALLTGVCLLVPFALLNLITKLGYYNHIIGYQLVPWNFEDMARRLGRVAGDHPILILITAASLLWCGYELLRAALSNKSRARFAAMHRVIAGWMFPLYLGVAVVSLFTIGAYQGNYNLVLDVFPPLLIVSGFGLARLVGALGQVEKVHFRPALVALSLLTGGMVIWQIVNLAAPGTYFSLGSMPGNVRREMLQGLEKQLAAAPGDLLTDEMYLALKAGRAVPYDNLYHMRLESQNGKWDDRQFLQDLRDRRFGIILLEHDARRWTERGWQTLNENYELVFPDGIDLWRPRPRPTAPQHALTGCNLAAPDGKGQAGLLGWSIKPANLPLRAGQNLVLTTYWQGGTAFARDYVLFAHLRDSTGKVIAQRDSSPALPSGSPRPFTGWQSGELLQIDQSFELPANLASGDYNLVVGAYRSEGSGLQALVPTCPAAIGNDIQLGKLGIAKV